MTFQLLPSAEAEAIEAAVWYDDQRAGLGDEFLTELDRTFERLCQSPQACSRLEAYQGPHDVRRSLLDRFPYMVIFLHRPSDTIVLSVSHVRRRPFFWLERLK